ncbi:MAG: type II toxin-antitoxin system HipA family toxin [Parasphingorhabdus sp.]|nr:type II toxin-antitoxin system HipA family toxin [Sphingorhabdus sp. YGSMI21]ATW03252.1 toxin HipA [Sphingorhabdus sp. YGSMI21]
MTRAVINLWGRQIGAVLWDEGRNIGVFEYTPEFVRSGIEAAPLSMPLRSGVYDFPALPFETFKGLPGMLADSLPDKFGNALINRWLAEQGRSPDSFDPVERLCYTGRRGMGALEFEPAAGEPRSQGGPIELAPLIELANRVIAAREDLAGVLNGDDDHHALQEILRVGTSAGGARAKAVLAWNEETGEFHSGQLKAGPGYTQWLLKFDGVSGNADKELADPMGYGRLEYACYLLAKEAGIAMMRSRLHEEGGRAHFMTQRFDRTEDGRKLHMQSLCAMRHFDFNLARAYSYEQAIETIRILGLGRDALKEQVRRALLNIFIRNQDDHTKNIAFLMDRDGSWSLSPAFDVTYAYNPSGVWTSEHQMSLAGKTDNFNLEDLITFGKFADLKAAETKAIIAEIKSAIGKWDQFAQISEIPRKMAEKVSSGFRNLEIK